MSDLSDKLVGLVETVVEPLVVYPDEVEVTCSSDDREILVEIASNPDDVGKIIGRQGRIIKAIRTLARAAGAADDRRIEVEILD